VGFVTDTTKERLEKENKQLNVVGFISGAMIVFKLVCIVILNALTSIMGLFNHTKDNE